MKKFLTSGLSALLLTACVTPSSETAQATRNGRDCFAGSSVSGYNYVDPNHVRLIVGPHRKYIMTTTWDARDLDWGTHVAIHSTSNWICTGNGLGVEVSGGTPRRVYPITSIDREPEPPAPVQGS